MKIAALATLTLAFAAAIARIWTADPRWTWTGVALLAMAIILGLILVVQAGMEIERAEQADEADQEDN